MRIRMLKTAPGSIDGVRITSYEAGQEYDLSSTPSERFLASNFVSAQLAEEAGGASAVAVTDLSKVASASAAEPPVPSGDDAAPALEAKPARKSKAQ